MFGTASQRVATIAVLSGSLLVGAAVVPAAAAPAEEAVYLSAMKDVWSTLTPKVHRTTCYAYRISPTSLITQSVANALKDPVAANALSRRAWRGVITDYLAWACSGPGTTPR